MNDSPPIFTFRRGESVTHDDKTYFWGAKAGKYRVLLFSRDGGTGILVPEIEVGKTIFPGLNDFGIFDDKHAVSLTYSDKGELAIRIRVLQIGPNKWVGGVDARYGDQARRSGVLHPDLPFYETADESLTTQLQLVVADLSTYGRKNVSAQSYAKKALLALLSSVSENIRDAVLLITREPVDA